MVKKGRIFAALSLLLSGCATNQRQIREVLISNPEIVSEAIRQNPDVVLDVIRENPDAIAEAIGSEPELVEEQEEQEEQGELDDQDLEVLKEMFGSLGQLFEKPVEELALEARLEPQLDRNRATIGSQDAPIVIVEYSDFECPFSNRGFWTMEKVLAVYGEKIHYVYKHLPLPFHPMAKPASLRYEAIAARDPEKAIAFRRLLFENQEELSTKGLEYLDEALGQLGLDVNSIVRRAESADIIERVDSDMREAEKLGFEGTPGFVIGGIPLRGSYPFSRFEEIICYLLKDGEVDSDGDSDGCWELVTPNLERLAELEGKE